MFMCRCSRLCSLYCSSPCLGRQVLPLIPELTNRLDRWANERQASVSLAWSQVMLVYRCTPPCLTFYVGWGWSLVVECCLAFVRGVSVCLPVCVCLCLSMCVLLENRKGQLFVFRGEKYFISYTIYSNMHMVTKKKPHYCWPQSPVVPAMGRLTQEENQ